LIFGASVSLLDTACQLLSEFPRYMYKLNENMCVKFWSYKSWNGI